MKREFIKIIEYDIIDWNYKGQEEKDVLERCGLAGWELICIVDKKAYFKKAKREEFVGIYSDEEIIK